MKPLRGFEDTDILPFGGWLGDVTVSDGAEVLLSYVPAFPVYPPKTSWMREPRTKIPGLVVKTTPSSGKVAFLVGDVDRRFAADNLPDHGWLLANLVRWAGGKQLRDLQVEGPGLLDCRLYRQASRLILHLVNLTNTESRGSVDELIPIGPIKVWAAIPPWLQHKQVRLLVGSGKPKFSFERGKAMVTLSSLLDHEVIVIGESVPGTKLAVAFLSPAVWHGPTRGVSGPCWIKLRGKTGNPSSSNADEQADRDVELCPEAGLFVQKHSTGKIRTVKAMPRKSDANPIASLGKLVTGLPADV